MLHHAPQEFRSSIRRPRAGIAIAAARARALALAIALCGLVCLAGAARVAHADAITITSYAGTNHATARVYDAGADTRDEDAHQFTTYPAAGTVAVTAGVDNSSSTTYSLNDTGLVGSLNQSRDADFNSSNFQFSGATGGIRFSFIPTEDLTYSISGSYSVLGSTSRMDFFAGLFKIVPSGTQELFFSFNSNTTAGGPSTFTVGGSEGQDYSDLRGSATGTLTKGTHYLFSSYAVLEGANESTGGATGTGSINFDIAPTAAPVPLPAAAWGGFALLGGIVATKVRKKRALVPSL